MIGGIQQRTQTSGSGSVWLEVRFNVFRIPEGFKLVAVGERCATPTDGWKEMFLTLKGSYLPRYSAIPSGSELFAIGARGHREALAPGY